MEDVKALIHGNSTDDQVVAIDHIGKHARLLAGPGTGKTKTLTRRVLSLVLLHSVEPESILLLTFTRLAARQLRKEIAAVLEPHGKSLPQISTLHSFALRQILFNSNRLDTLPRPIRIADDWEERFIIQEDLKKVLGLKKIDEVQILINQLSTDWETLRIDEVGWEQQFPNPAFLGAWRAHAQGYGETLRAELVYQLKKQLSQNRDFQLDREYKHVLVDEYQDLNACDLAIVAELAKHGSELFVAGDDDQSIYGFRFASPTGIRNFPQMYDNSEKLALEICFRCDKNILQAAEFVAALDPARLPKPTRPRDNAEDGVVMILGCKDQDHEAIAVAKAIEGIIAKGTRADEIAILLRSDHAGALSTPIINALKGLKVKVALVADSDIERNDDYRIVLSLLRLLVDERDSLAWRTLLQVSKNRLGDECIRSIWDLSQKNGVRFHSAMAAIESDQKIVPKFGPKIGQFMETVKGKITAYREKTEATEIVTSVVEDCISDEVLRAKVKQFLLDILEHQEGGLPELLKSVSTSSEQIEQETKENAVNILTMHQAKGLTFDVCFVVGAEDEFIPGRNTGDKEGDERRLLYVSMTRARHKLYVTYCQKRTGRQMHLGSKSGTPNRTLTRFLRDSKVPLRQLKS